MGYYYTKLEIDIKIFFKSIGINRPTDFDLYYIAQELDVWIYYHNDESEVYKSKSGLYSIFLNENLSPQEQWQDFCHEVGHVRRHVGNQHKMNKLFRELQESQADSFMYHFCIPTFMLDVYDFPYYHGQAIEWIARDFNVTIEFARERFYMYLDKQFSLKFDKEFRQSLIAEHPKEYTTEDIMDFEFNLDNEILPEEVYHYRNFTEHREDIIKGTTKFLRIMRKKGRL